MNILEALRQTTTSIKTWVDDKFLKKNEATADDFGIYVQDTEPINAVAGDIWVDTANDPTVIDTEIPDTLPNPHALTLTGAATGVYDGSSAVRITIPDSPSKTSELVNDSGFITEYTESDPTVPSWAKQLTKPTYTASEVGAEPSGTAATKVGTHNTDTDSHNDIRLDIQSLANKLNTFLDSDDTTLDELSELITAIEGNQTSIEQITSGKVNVADVVNNLTTNTSTKPLSAAQGVALKKLIDAIVVPTKVSQLTNDSGYITTAPVQSVNGKTGAVEITAANIGAQPVGNYVMQSEIGNLAMKDVVDKTDLTSDVQASLNKANSALQSYTETDPTVPVWAKASSKPSYSKSEIGLGNVDNVKQYSASNPPPYPVTSVNSKTGAVSLTHSDVGADASGTASSLLSTHNTATNVHMDIRNALAEKQTKGDYALKSDVPTKVSQLTNDNGYLTGYTENDPTVPSWAKASSKPTYNKSEVGLGNVDNVKQYSASNPPPYPVTSVNGKTGAITIAALPSVTTADNGKVLMVVNGKWSVVDINLSIDANGVVFM